MDIFVDDSKHASWTSSGLTTAAEHIELGGVTGNAVELRGVLEDSEWLSIMEVRGVQKGRHLGDILVSTSEEKISHTPKYVGFTLVSFHHWFAMCASQSATDKTTPHLSQIYIRWRF